MIVTNKDTATFYREIDSIIEQMGNTVILRSNVDGEQVDVRMRCIFFNQSTITNKGLSEKFNYPGTNFETGFVFVVNYRDLQFIPQHGSLVLVPQYTHAGIALPLKIQDVFQIAEVEPVIIKNILLFLLLNTSRSELNTWAKGG